MSPLGRSYAEVWLGDCSCNDEACSGTLPLRGSSIEDLAKKCADKTFPSQWSMSNVEKLPPIPAEQHLFYRDQTGLIQHIFWNGGFSSPDQWNAGKPKAAGELAAMATPGQQHLFYRDENGLIQHIYWDGQFHGPDQWNAGMPKAAGGVAAMATPGQQHLFYRDENGLIQHIYWDGPFHGPEQWNVSMPKALDDPAVMFVEAHDPP